jgi:hypothetical protein
MPEIAVSRLIAYGLQQLRADEESFRDLFCYLSHDPFMVDTYGPSYVDRLWEWFNTDKIKVIQGWSLNMQSVPCYSITLSSEVEDESTASFSDYYGDDECNELLVYAKIVNLDIGCHGSKSPDQVIWLYYILSYILFKNKRYAESMGLELQTATASDWARDNGKTPENIFTRWVRMRVKSWDTLIGDRFSGPYDLEINLDTERLRNEQEESEI